MGVVAPRPRDGSREPSHGYTLACRSPSVLDQDEVALGQRRSPCTGSNNERLYGGYFQLRTHWPGRKIDDETKVAPGRVETVRNAGEDGVDGCTIS